MKTKILFGFVGVVLAVCLCGGLIFAYNNLFYPLKHKEEILNASKNYNIKPEIVASIINAESRFNEKAVSKKGAKGLMQVLPSTANWAVKALKLNAQNVKYTTETKQEINLFNPQTNIEIGTCYFGYLLQKFGNLNTALCAYNAGEGTVKNWLKNKEFSSDGETIFNIPYSETKAYVKKVNNYIKIYQKKFK